MRPKGTIPAAVRVIQLRVAFYYGVTFDDLLAPGRTARVAWPRQVAMFLASRNTDVGCVLIGRAFNRTGWTVTHAERTVRNACSTEPDRAKQVKELEGMV